MAMREKEITTGNTLPGLGRIKGDSAGETATQSADSFLRELERMQKIRLQADVRNQFLSLAASRPDLVQTIRNIAGTDPGAIQALAAFLDPDGPLITGMKDVVSNLAGRKEITQNAARQLIVAQILEEARDPGKRNQGSRSLCVDAQFVRNRFSAAEYVRCVSELAVKGHVEHRDGAHRVVLEAPEGWHHVNENLKYYESQSSMEDLLMCSVRWLGLSADRKAEMTASNFENLRGTTASAGRERLDLLTGKRHGCVWGNVALLYAFEQQRQGRPAEVVTRWIPEGSAAAGGAGNHVFHCIGLDKAQGSDVLISNTWGTPVRGLRHDFTMDGPETRRGVSGIVSGEELLSVSELQDNIQWGWVEESAARLVVTEDHLKFGGFKNLEELRKYIDWLREDRGWTNISLNGNVLILDISKEAEQTDISIGGPDGTISGPLILDEFNREFAEYKRRKEEQDKKTREQEERIRNAREQQEKDLREFQKRYTLL